MAIHEEVLNFRQQRYANHTPLCTMLPLDTPLSIMIEPTNICNFRCIFCPTGDEGLIRSVSRPKGTMPFDLFCNIVDDISLFDNKVRSLLLYKDGEPLLNANLDKMIEYAKNKQIADKIHTTTNASLLTAERAILLIKAGLDDIRISVEHLTSDGYKELTRTYGDYHTIRKNIEFLYNKKIKMNSSLQIHVKMLDVSLSEEDKSRFVDEFSDISDSINIDTLCGWSNTQKKDFTLGNSISYSLNSIVPLRKDRIVCPEPFKSLAINFNGTVSLCQVDWAHAVILGNVRKSSVREIWKGQNIHNYRMKMLYGQRDSIEPCEDCHFIQGEPEVSELDHVANELIEVYQNKQPRASA
ncbi:radical SAM/SPASM domain-containing protein [Thermodesulfobacteriota bacterium]